MSTGFEIFKSNEPIHPADFYVYDVEFELVKDSKDNKKENSIVNIMNSLCMWLNIRTGYKLAIGKVLLDDKKYIISFGEIPEQIVAGKCYGDIYKYTLSHMDRKQLDIQTYKDYYKYYVKNMLKRYFTRYHGVYYIEDDTIYSECTFNRNALFKEIHDKNNFVKLRRRYFFEVDIDSENYILLKCNFGCEFLSKMSVAEYWEKGKSLLGMKVRYLGETSRAQVGTIVDEHAGTVGTYKIPNTNQSLKDYVIPRLCGKKQALIKAVDDESRVIKLKLTGGHEYVYYPQLCYPVYTFENVRAISQEFSKTVARYVKMDMVQRMVEDKAFIADINNLRILSKRIGEISFNVEPLTVDKLGWNESILPAPQYVFYGGKTSYRKQDCFNYGMYKDMIEDRNKLNILYIVPDEYDEMKLKSVRQTFKRILTNNRDKDEDKTNSWLVRTFKNIHSKMTVHTIRYNLSEEGYDVYNKINKEHWDDIKNKREDIGNIDIALIALPEGHEIEGKMYQDIKGYLKKLSIPSQAITCESMDIIFNKKYGYDYYIYNILLGVYSKLGGIPFVINNVSKDIDCFFGVDVAMAEKGIHYPSCAAACLGDGSFLGWNMNVLAQSGEKIKSDLYKRLFLPFIHRLKEIHPNKKLNVVLMRDGHFFEDRDEFLALWNKYDINVSVFEVLKSNVERLWIDEANMNPMKGTCIIKGEEAIIVTTSPRKNQGAPRPIRIRKVMGDVDISTMAAQAYYLSEMHVGTTHTTRLPVPIEYADKICKARDYLPNVEGEVCKQMYFL